jgi:hypothetical protein
MPFIVFESREAEIRWRASFLRLAGLKFDAAHRF